jgi:hypothetical protein
VSLRLLRAVTSIEGRLLRSVAPLLGAPGSLTPGTVSGERKPHVAPLPCSRATA